MKEKFNYEKSKFCKIVKELNIQKYHQLFAATNSKENQIEKKIL